MSQTPPHSPDHSPCTHAGKRVIVNSLPKSGTHLVEKAIRLLTGWNQPPLQISSATAGRFAPADPGDPLAPIGVGLPVQVSIAKLRDALGRLVPGQLVTAHIPHSPAMASLLSDLGFGMFLVIRDPRDVAVSLAHHILTHPQHRLYAHFQTLTPEERLLAALRGIPDRLQDIAARSRAVLPWAGEPFAITVRFEDLIGQQGGGDPCKQNATLEQIAHHLGLESVQNLQDVQEKLFGNSATFRTGQQGQWRQAFTPIHHQAFAEIAGGLLADLGMEPDRRLERNALELK